MTVNQKMFAEIDEIISSLPELHRQHGWEERPEENGTCGTTRCVAGWAVWLAAKEHGLLSRKRDETTIEVRKRLADILDLPHDSDDEYYYNGCYRTDYDMIGGKLLGLSGGQAHTLFHDMHNKRVAARVHAFATTGQDLPDEEQERFAED